MHQRDAGFHRGGKVGTALQIAKIYKSLSQTQYNLSRDEITVQAYSGDDTVRTDVLIAVGIPILGLVTWQHGPWIGMLILAMGMSVLRWPIIYLGRWIKRVTLR